MATITYSNHTGVAPSLGDVFDADGIFLSSNTSTVCDIVNDNGGAWNGYIFRVIGTGFTYDSIGKIVTGTVTGGVIIDTAGNVIAVFDTLPSNVKVQQGVYDFLNDGLDYLLRGDDITNGSDGDDRLTTYGGLEGVPNENTLNGGKGNDVLISHGDERYAGYSAYYGGGWDTSNLNGGEDDDIIVVEGPSHYASIDGGSGFDSVLINGYFDFSNDFSGHFIEKLDNVEKVIVTEDSVLGLGPSEIMRDQFVDTIEISGSGDVFISYSYNLDGYTRDEYWYPYDVDIDLSGWRLTNRNSGVLIDFYSPPDGSNWGYVHNTNPFAYHKVIGTSKNDEMRGGLGIDEFNGFDGNDVLKGSDGNDILDGGKGGDELYGEDGDDTLFSRQGELAAVGGLEYLDGGDGVDLAVIERPKSALNFVLDLTDPAVLQDLGDGTQIINVERIQFHGGVGNDTITGGAYADIINGGAGTNNLNGAGGADILVGGDQSDTLLGGDGGDSLTGNKGVDVLNGGAGRDVANYDTAFAAVTINLALTTAQNTGGGGTDTLIDIEDLVGSAFNDVFKGSAANNMLLGRAGNDTLSGSGGADTLQGDSGNDVLAGGAGNDTYVFGLADGLDSITEAGAGTADSIQIASLGGVLSSFNVADTGGGSGNLVVSFSGQQVTVNNHFAGGVKVVETLSFVGGAVYAGFALSSSPYILSFDDVGERLGTAGNDIIAGDGLANLVTGAGGDDLLFGGAGTDALTGGAGGDLLAGGAGNDRFDFNAVSDSTAAKRDVLAGFVHGADKIDLSTIDGKAGTAVNDAFLFKGQSTAVTAYSISWYESGGQTIIQIDNNGNTTADMVIAINGTGLGLSAGDFIL